MLPLKVVGDITNTLELRYIDSFVRNGNTGELCKAIKVFIEENYEDMYSAILDVSKQFEDGARKYDSRNWEKGIPLHCYIDSGTRHLLRYKRGDRDEPHDRAFLWNMLCAIWTHDNLPEMIDLPFRESIVSSGRGSRLREALGMKNES